MSRKVLLRQREKVAFLLLNGIGCLRAQRPTNQLLKPLPRNGRFIIGCLNRVLDHVDQLFQLRTLGQQSVPLLARDIRNVDVVLLTPTFAVDPDARRHAQTQFPRDVDPKIDLRLPGTVLSLSQYIRDFCHRITI